MIFKTPKIIYSFQVKVERIHKTLEDFYQTQLKGPISKMVSVEALLFLKLRLQTPKLHRKFSLSPAYLPYLRLKQKIHTALWPYRKLKGVLAKREVEELSTLWESSPKIDIDALRGGLPHMPRPESNLDKDALHQGIIKLKTPK